MPAPTAADLVPWRLVDRLVTSAVPAGPSVTGPSRRRVVALLRRSAEDALPWAARTTGLGAAARAAAAVGGPGAGGGAVVVDRAGLGRAGARWLRAVLAGVPVPDGAGSGGRAAAAAAALETAAALGAVSTRVLGQVLPGVDGAAPRLLLVAPNVLETQLRLDLDLLDLPAWVALHEASHLLQLHAAPWLGQLLVGGTRGVVASALRTGAAEGTAGVLTALLRGALGPGGSAGEGRGAPSGDRAAEARPAGRIAAGLLDAEGTAGLERLVTALSVMEGHAETVLDAVTTAELPSAHVLRARLGHRLSDDGPTSLIGGALRAKESQYVAGARFARAVVARGGHESLNLVWRSPEALPSPSELRRPADWLGRVRA